MKQTLISARHLMRFTSRLFETGGQKAAYIFSGILRARSIRLSEISQHMEGNAEGNYKAIQRFLKGFEPSVVLRRLLIGDPEFIIADPTEIERPQARNTDYVGYLKDGKTRGFQLLILACPYKGRAIPFHFINYSSSTIGQEATSRNLEHKRALRGAKGLIGKRPIVLDREFSYEGFIEACQEEGIDVIIRLHVGSGVIIRDEEGERLSLELRPGQTVVKEGVYYKGRLKVNLVGKWQRGFTEPLWLITSLPPEEAFRMYQGRMKIEESFRDLKGLLGMEKVMNKKRDNMEKMVALLLIAYSLGLLIGEELRQRLYLGCRREQYSGLFILLRHKLRVLRETAKEVIDTVLSFFQCLTPQGVQTHRY
jgi:hypothetical protein